jgi:hypothetical protein
MLLVLLFLGVLSAIWVVGYLSERTAARKLGRLRDEGRVWRGFIQLFLTLWAMTALSGFMLSGNFDHLLWHLPLAIELVALGELAFIQVGKSSTHTSMNER